MFGQKVGVTEHPNGREEINRKELCEGYSRSLVPVIGPKTADKCIESTLLTSAFNSDHWWFCYYSSVGAKAKRVGLRVIPWIGRWHLSEIKFRMKLSALYSFGRKEGSPTSGSNITVQLKVKPINHSPVPSNMLGLVRCGPAAELKVWLQTHLY